MTRAVDQAWSRLGGIDMLVNNAGIGMRTVNPRFMTHPQGFWEVPAAGFRAVIETNLTGYFLVAREVTPRMLAAGGGRIVNISVSHSTMHRAGWRRCVEGSADVLSPSRSEVRSPGRVR